jgi:hypothetical protein
MQTQDSIGTKAGFELLFDSLATDGRTYAFPCDERGEVDLDHLSDTLRRGYFFARASIGLALRFPVVRSAVDR